MSVKWSRVSKNLVFLLFAFVHNILNSSIYVVFLSFVQGFFFLLQHVNQQFLFLVDFYFLAI